jgi:hypothetical protein
MLANVSALETPAGRPLSSPSMNRHLPVLLACCAVGAASCAHRKPVADAASLRVAADSFFRFLRWGPDLQGASQLIAREERRRWRDAALDRKDDENLKVTETELENLSMEPDGAGLAEVKLTWHRLPSVTTRTERVKVHFREEAGVWFAESIEGGPLPLSAAAAPDAGGGAPPQPRSTGG